MANRVPLSNVVIPGAIQNYLIAEGTATLLASSGAAATVYASSTGTSTLTSTAVPYSRALGTLRGFVTPGEYTLRTASGFDWKFEATPGDSLVGDPGLYAWEDPTLSCQNFPYMGINSASCTTTSGTVKFVRIRPKSHVTAAKIVSFSGTAIATITNSYVGLYTSDGTTMTRVAVNATNTTSGLWDTNNTAYRQALNPATVVLEPGIDYFVAMLVVATTGGTHFGFVKTSNTPAVAATEVAPPMYTLAGQTALDATEAISGMTAAYDLVPWVAVTA